MPRMNGEPAVLDLSGGRREWELARDQTTGNDETTKAFAAFETYRAQGDGRSYRQVAQDLGKADTLIAGWGKRWCWQQRVRAWEVEMARVARAAERAERRRMAERHANIGKGLQNEVIRALQKRDEEWQAHAADPVKNRPPEPLNGHEIARFAREGTAIELRARGEPTETHQHQVGPAPPAPDPAAEKDPLDALLDDPEAAVLADQLAERLASFSRGDGRTPDEDGAGAPEVA